MEGGKKGRRTRKQLIEELAALKKREEHRRQVEAELWKSEERARQQIAAVLHDSIAQILVTIKIKLDSLRGHVSADGKQTLAEMCQLISHAVQQTRVIASQLSPPVLHELGFIPALEWLGEQMESQHGMPVEFDDKAHSVQLDHDMEVLLYQAARELLMNVVKHARAKSAKVSVSGSSGLVKIEVSDDGIGMEAAQVEACGDSISSHGLFSIRERLKHFGGELTVRSGSGGTQVVVVAPGGKGVSGRELNKTAFG